MYTKGIRKIYSSKIISVNLSTLEFKAAQAGYQAFEFNGIIYVQVEAQVWLKTCFLITDFSDEQV